MKCLLLIGMCICSNILHGALTPSDMSMAMFKSGLVKEPTVFKVMISVAGHDYCWDYQIDKFRDQFWAVRMRPVHSKDDLGRTGLYCSRNRRKPGKLWPMHLKMGVSILHWFKFAILTSRSLIGVA